MTWNILFSSFQRQVLINTKITKQTSIIMNKTRIYAIAIATILLTGYTAYNAHNKQETTNLLLANVEALADNESDTDMNCEGILGICKFNCPYCSFSWSAIGSHIVGSHKCSQSK